MKKDKKENAKPVAACFCAVKNHPRREGFLVDPKTGSLTSTRIVIGGEA